MATFIEHYRLFKVSGAKYCAMFIILLLIGNMATATLEAQEAPKGLAFLRTLGIAVTPHEKDDKSLPGQRVFEAVVDQKQSRVYRFHSTQMDITYLEVKLVADHPEDWKLGRFTKGKVSKGDFLYVEIIFQPQEARTSEAILVFKLEQKKFLGPNTVTVKIPLLGKGIVPESKTATPGGKTIPKQKSDEGQDKTKSRDTSVKKICLDFILVDNKDTKTWDRKAREWTEKSNKIFKKSKVKVVFSKPRPIAEDKIKEEAGKSAKGGLHCFPVFIVEKLPDGASNASGYTASEYIGDDRDGDVDEKFYNGKKADKLAGRYGIHERYRGGMVYGTAIYILQNLNISGTVLAHELGHTLGGGVSERVRREEAEVLKETEEGKLKLARRQSAHLDPKTGAELDESAEYSGFISQNHAS